MLLSKNIIACRKTYHMTQDELAEALNVSSQSVSKWESGQAQPDVDKVLAMSRLFHVTMDALIHGDPVEVAPPLPRPASAPEMPAQPAAAKNKKRKWKPIVLAAAGLVAVGVLVTVLVLLGGADTTRPAASEQAETAPRVTADSAVLPTSTPVYTPKPFDAEAAKIKKKPLTVPGYGVHPSRLKSGHLVSTRAMEWNGKIVLATWEGLYLMEQDGSDITPYEMQGNGYFGFLQTVGDSLFFFSNGEIPCYIYRLDADGRVYTYKWSEGQIDYLCYYDGWLYFLEMRDNGGAFDYYMHRIQSDLCNSQELFRFPVQPVSVNVYGTCVYYRDAQGSRKGINEINWETGETRTLYQGTANQFYIDGDDLYAFGGSSTPITRISLITEEVEKLPNPNGMDGNNIHLGEYIYYVTNGRDSNVYRYDPRTGENNLLYSFDGNGLAELYGAGDWLFAVNTSIEFKVYAIHLPSGVVQPFLGSPEDNEPMPQSLDGWKDQPIVWKDATVEQCVRTAIGKPDGDVTLRDAEQVTALYLVGNAFGFLREPTGVVCGADGVTYGAEFRPLGKIQTLEDLRCFTKLRVLGISMGDVGCSFAPLSDISSLRELHLGGAGWFTAGDKGLGTLKQLEKLTLRDESLTDVSFLGGMTGLKQLDITARARDFSVLGDMPQLESAHITAALTPDELAALEKMYLDISMVTSGFPSD